MDTQLSLRSPADPTVAAHPDCPPLMRISEVERNHAPDSGLGRTAHWVRTYLAQPHERLGRQGAVCPFVPVSLQMDSLWFAEVDDPTPTFEHLSEVVMEYRRRFLEMVPTTGSEAMQKAILIVFPALSGEGPLGAGLVDAVQFALKKHFVQQGLMLGEFHATNASPGLRNKDFLPLRSPVPLLAIRNMVESDLPFLVSDAYRPRERASFLRAYISRMKGQLKPGKFEQVLDRLIAEEISILKDDAMHGAADALVAPAAAAPHACRAARGETTHDEGARGTPARQPSLGVQR